jgi:hypothetical protein
VEEAGVKEETAGAFPGRVGHKEVHRGLDGPHQKQVEEQLPEKTRLWGGLFEWRGACLLMAECAAGVVPSPSPSSNTTNNQLAVAGGTESEASPGSPPRSSWRSCRPSGRRSSPAPARARSRTAAAGEGAGAWRRCGARGVQRQEAMMLCALRCAARFAGRT